MGTRALTAFFISALTISLAPYAAAKVPDCTHRDAYPSGMAFTYLKNAGVFRDDELDVEKTTVKRLASEKISKDIYRQVHLIRFTKLSGVQFSAITINEVSAVECSMSGVDVFLISKRLGDYSKQ
jgi:hypothetical protein